MTKNLDDAGTKDAVVEKAQRLRLRRFWMSVATYFVALLATFLITQLGIGGLSGVQWTILIGWCVFGICLFFILFYTNQNLRFTEPSLTREQIVYSSFYGTLAMFWLPEARPIIFLFVLAPFSFGMLILTFRQFLTVAVWLMAIYAVMLTFDYVIHPQDFDFKYQIFLFSLFSLILIWFAFFGGFVSKLRSRLWVQKEALKEMNEELQKEIQDREKAQLENERLIGELKESLLKVRTLEGIIPICMHCKEIRDDKGAWNQLEKYISENSEAQFSHSICEKCRILYYPEYQK
jgi:hypothetical protein